MITKLIRAIVLLLALAPLAPTPISAGQAKATVKIFLKFTVGQGDFPTATVENNTSFTIPAGTTIHWSVCPGLTRPGRHGGSMTLDAPLATGRRASWSVESPYCARNVPYTPKAWYFK
jgi:hypothetical protein